MDSSIIYNQIKNGENIANTSDEFVEIMSGLPGNERLIINTTDDISILGADYGVYYDGTYVIGFEDQADYDNAICYCVTNGYQFAIDGDMAVCGNGSFITNASINPSATTRVAVIDTGSNLANESYSVIGDDTNDYNGHGEISNVYAAVQYAMDMDPI